MICLNHFKRRAKVPQLILAPAIGPEVLTGSTRLKAGTVTKLILNCITTLAMVRLGKVAGNLMVDVDPKMKNYATEPCASSATLREVDANTARAALAKHGWVVQDTLKQLQ